jgi:hemoglobin
MVGRHAPFAITPLMRRIWLLEYQKALETTLSHLPMRLKASFWDYLNTFSTWMVNTSK